MALEKLIIASNNKDKAKEIASFFEKSGVTLKVRPISELSDAFDPEETGSTLAENALIKARAAAALCDAAVLADDTGLKVDALYGAPGVHSARYAGKGASYQENCDKLLKALKGYKEPDRDAKFVCHMTLIVPDGRQFDVEESIAGRITMKALGDSGFGYDPVFLLPERECTLAELSLAEKNQISHRAKALAAIVKTLAENDLISRS